MEPQGMKHWNAAMWLRSHILQRHPLSVSSVLPQFKSYCIEKLLIQFITENTWTSEEFSQIQGNFLTSTLGHTIDSYTTVHSVAVLSLFLHKEENMEKT